MNPVSPRHSDVDQLMAMDALLSAPPERPTDPPGGLAVSYAPPPPMVEAKEPADLDQTIIDPISVAELEEFRRKTAQQFDLNSLAPVPTADPEPSPPSAIIGRGSLGITPPSSALPARPGAAPRPGTPGAGRQPVARVRPVRERNNHARPDSRSEQPALVRVRVPPRGAPQAQSPQPQVQLRAVTAATTKRDALAAKQQAAWEAYARRLQMQRFAMWGVAVAVGVGVGVLAFWALL